MNSRKLTRGAICVTLIVIASYIAFPLPLTPSMVTAQTLVINVIGLILTPKEALLTMGIYTTMGIIGLPVFVGGSSGIGKILGPSGGYYIAFLIVPAVISLLKGQRSSFKRYLLVTIGVGIPIIYFFGTLGMSIYQQVGFIEVLTLSVLPFIVGDLMKCIGAVYVSLALKKALPTLREVY